MIKDWLLIQSMELLVEKRIFECELKGEKFNFATHKFVVSPELYEVLRKSYNNHVYYNPKEMRLYTYRILVECGTNTDCIELKEL